MFAALLIEGGNIGRYREGCVRINSIGSLGELHLVRTEWCAVRLLAPRLVWRTEANDGAYRNQTWSLIGDRPINGAINRLDVIAVFDARGMPTVGIKTLQHILGPGGRGRPVELNQVVVPEVDQLAELQVSRERRGFGGDPLLQVAVRDDGEDAVVNDVVPWAVELFGEATFRNRHANAVGEPLTERAGGGFNACGEAELWVTRGERAPLAECLEVVERQAISGEMNQRVEECACMSIRKNEAVAIEPAWCCWGVAQVSRPDGVRHRGATHRCAWMSTVGRLHRINGEGANRGDGRLVEALIHGSLHPSIRQVSRRRGVEHVRPGAAGRL